MILLMDVGNTRCKWAWLQGKEFRDADSAVCAGGDISAATGALATAGHRPDRILIGTVGDARTTRELEEFCTRTWACAPEFVVARAQGHGVTNAYREPARLGVDRWIAMVAARARVSGAVCIADCGTAVTVDLMDGAGRHHGGIILPGVRAMREVLVAKTANLGMLAQSFVDSPKLPAVDTPNAISGGALSAVAGAIQHMRQHAAELFGGAPTLLLTGGDAEMILPLLAQPVVHEPQLVLQGLAVIAAGNH